MPCSEGLLRLHALLNAIEISTQTPQHNDFMQCVWIINGRIKEMEKVD